LASVKTLSMLLARAQGAWQGCVFYRPGAVRAKLGRNSASPRVTGFQAAVSDRSTADDYGGHRRCRHRLVRGFDRVHTGSHTPAPFNRATAPTAPRPNPSRKEIPQ
jgi:hypothetical protein